jgi:hypothetical protein
MVPGDPWLPPDATRNPKVPLVDNGIVGDPRPTTPEMAGKRHFDLKTKNAVAQIQAMIAAAK